MPDAAVFDRSADPANVSRIPFGAPPADIGACLARDGGVILSGVLTRGEVVAVNRDLDIVMGPLSAGNFGDGETNYLAAFMGARTKRLQHCVKYSRTYRERYLANARLAEYVSTLLPGRTTSHTLFSTQAIEIFPGEQAQQLHRDGGGFMERLGLNHAGATELVVNTLLALTDITEEMGATRIIPGSHKWPDFNDCGAADLTVPAIMAAGDVLLFSGKLLHGGGANRTQDRSRRVISTAWSLSLLVPEEAWPFVVSVEEVRDYPPSLRAAMGFHSLTYRDEEPGFLWRVDNKPLEQHLGLEVPLS